MVIKKFQRGETTYTCQSCKKLTRNTGGDEKNCRLCLDCYELAGLDNYLSDNGCMELAKNYGDEIETTFNRRPELKDAFPKLVQAMTIRQASADDFIR